MYPSHVWIGAKIISADQNRKLENLQIAYLNEDTALLKQIKAELKLVDVTANIAENGSVTYSVASEVAIDIAVINHLIAARFDARKAKDWKESDRIRDELDAMGVAIKDNKDGTTTWEVKR